MATQEDVRRIALALPETTEDPSSFRFSVDGKAYAWAWLQRLDPKRARVPSPDVIAVRVANEFEKEGLLGLDPDVFFTEPAHYDGYPAVLAQACRDRRRPSGADPCRRLALAGAEATDPQRPLTGSVSRPPATASPARTGCCRPGR